MKNTRALIVLAIAALAGLAAVMIAQRWLSQQSASGIARVAVAATEISLGQRISPEMVKLVDWPSGSVPPGVVSDLARLEGRVVRSGLQRGEPVLETKLAAQGTQGGLSAVIGEGRRAITVRVNDVIGVAGFALPGNYVDIIVNTQKDGDRNYIKDQNISKIVLERILVLAVAQEVGRDETKPKVVNAVTLEVTPEQAEKIDLARSVGTLSLVLRNQIDPADSTTAGATKSTLLGQTELIKVSEAEGRLAKPRPKQVVATRERPVSSRSGSGGAEIIRTPIRVNAECVGVINGLRNSQECY
jgi:pilus assembly protein CpaB